MGKESDDNRGYLITFEGSEGSGKSTQVAHMAERFSAAGYDIIVTREPGGTEIGEQVRHLLKYSVGGKMTPETELLLFAASRAQLVREVMEPALAAGKIVLCDRFMDSTTVYQGMARRLHTGPVHVINEFAVGKVTPDVTVVIDLPAEVGLQRIKHRVTDLPDRLEQENIEFYRKVREGYLMLAKALPERFIVVDGQEPVDVVSENIWRALRKRVI